MPVQADQVQPGPRHWRLKGAFRSPGRPGGQALHELQRAHHDVRGAVAPGRLEFEHDLPGGVDLEARPAVEPG